MLHPVFDPLQVTTSIVIAIVASYAALALSALIGTRSGAARIPWLIGGGFAVGMGIAGMHFVGMLAMQLAVPVTYDGTLTVISFAVAVIASTAALTAATGAAWRVRPMLLASAAFGTAVAGMHYIGTSAMRGPFDVSHDFTRVAVSILIAIVASAFAFWLAYRLRDASGLFGFISQLASATAMGGAVAGMHYTAMSAVVFSPRALSATNVVSGITGRDLTLLVTIVGLVILAGAILVALLAQRARHVARETALTNERYREMAEAMPQIVWTARHDGSIDYRNRRWFEYSGRQADDAIMSQLTDDVHADDSAEVVGRWANAVANGVPFEIEYRLRRAVDGEYRWHLGRAVPLRDASGAIVKWFGTCTDIDEQKRGETFLRAHQVTLEHRIEEREAEAERATELYQLLAENATDMVSTHRPDGVFEYATPSWQEFVGASPLGRTPAALSHPDDVELLIANQRLGFQASGLLTTVWRCRRPDGTYGWLETRTRAVRQTGTKRVITFVCATRDVTERRRLEEEFGLLHRTVLAVSDAPTLADALGVTLRELCEATGWSYGEVWMPSLDASLIERSAVWYGRQGVNVGDLAAASTGLTRQPGEGIAGQAWTDAKVLWVRDVTTDPRVGRASLAVAVGLRALVAVPVISEGVVVAVLLFMMPEAVAADEARVAFVSVVAAQLGAAIARKQAAQTLRNERRFLEALLDSLSEGIVALDASGKIRLMNRATREWHGEIPENLETADVPRKHNVYQLDGVTHLTPDELPLVRVLHGEEVRGQEYVVGTVAGELRTISANGQLIVDEDGKQLGAVMAARDITQHKRDEVALRESEAKYRQLVEQAADAILLVDADGRCAAANARAGLLMGVDPQTLVGRQLESFMVPAGTNASPAVLSAGDVITAEYAAHRADDVIVPVEVSVAALADGRVQIIARDISGRKELDRLKDEFVSMVSHELRTPLTAIRGSLGLLASGQLTSAPEKGQRMLAVAVTNTDRLIRLINDILDVERITSGAVAMESAWCDGWDITNQVVEAMRPIADRASVALEVRGSRVRLWADCDRITQTLTNLVGNAIKFSPQGAVVEIVVKATADTARFEVRDHGRGIPAAKLETIFERFQQVDASDARDKGGTGLGLAISRGIIRQHGGRIWAENNAGGGSVFKFVLPRPSDADDDSSASSGAAGAARKQPIRILVIEDDIELAHVMATALEARGFAVDVAHDGRAAIDSHGTSAADILIVDLRLPDMSGLDLIDRLRGGLGSSGARTIIYTASDPTPAVRERIRGMGADLATKGRVSTEALVERVIRGLEKVPIHPLRVA